MEPVTARSTGSIYVVGSSRSGTTLMGRILGQHPDILTFHELHFFEQLWEPSSPVMGLDPAAALRLAARLLAVQRDGYLAKRRVEPYLEEAREMIAGPPKEGWNAYSIYRRFLESETRRAGRRIACERTPRNVFFLRQLFSLEPEARVVVMLRDPRAVLLSQKNRWRRRRLGGHRIPPLESLRNAINYHPYTIGRLWAAGAAAAARFEGAERVLQLRFEDLIAEPEPTLRRTCEFLGVAFDARMLDVPQIGSSREPDQPDRRGIRAAAASAWTEGGLGPEEIYLCEVAARREMARLGILPIAPRPALGPLVWQWMRFPVHVMGAVVANLGRVKDPVAALRRRLLPGREEEGATMPKRR